MNSILSKIRSHDNKGVTFTMIGIPSVISGAGLKESV